MPTATFQRFLHSPYASWLTHGSLGLLAGSYFVLLWFAPFWVAFVPGVLLAHRIGILLHEYLHGIPFKRYRANLAVYGFFDGMMLMFGLLELFRGTHLAHHRWLNGPGDSAFRAAHEKRGGFFGMVANLEAIQHLKFLIESFRGMQPYVRPRRIVFGFLLSTLWLAFWWQLGRMDVVYKLFAISAFTTLVPVSLRGAIEHHSHGSDDGFANEYRVWLPLFNLNRHMHHHEDTRCPWYLLEYRTARPLSPVHYVTYWFRVYVRGDYVLMHPMPSKSAAEANVPDQASLTEDCP